MTHYNEVSPIHDAAAKGNIAKLRELFQGEQEVDEKDKVNNTPLVAAIYLLSFSLALRSRSWTHRGRQIVNNQRSQRELPKLDGRLSFA